ncbi:MAG: GerMN domain-containing protein [Clostridia bacterium]
MKCKKVLSIILVAVLASSVIGCSEKTKTDEGRNLTEISDIEKELEDAKEVAKDILNEQQEEKKTEAVTPKDNTTDAKKQEEKVEVEENVDKERPVEKVTVYSFEIVDINSNPIKIVKHEDVVESPVYNEHALANEIYKVAVENSKGALPKDAKVLGAKINNDGYLYITMDENFTKNWPGGTCYETNAFSLMAYSFMSIPNIDGVKIACEGNNPGFHTDLENHIFDGKLSEDLYEIVEK